MNRVLLFSALSFFYLKGASQNIDSLVNTVQADNRSELNLLNFNTKKYRERSWINLIPNLGYDFLNNRPFVSINISGALSYINSKRQTKFKQEQNAITYNNQLIADTLTLKAEYYKLQNLLSQQKEIIAQLRYDSLYIKIKQNENKNLQATAVELLKAKQTQEENQTKLYNVKNQIISQKLTIEQIIKKELPLIVPDNF